MRPQPGLVDRRRVRRCATTPTIIIITAVALAVVMSFEFAGLGTRALADAAYAVAAALAAVNAAVAHRRRPSPARLALAAGLTSWAIGFVTYRFDITLWHGAPTITDVGWLGGYPCYYVAVVSLARDRLVRHGGMRLDAIMGAFALGALGVAFIVPRALAVSSGSAGQTLTSLAYPLADALLLTLVVVVAAMAAWRPGRAFTALGGAFAVTIGADIVYFLRVAAGTWTPGGLVDLLWVLAAIAIGASAHARAPARPPATASPALALAMPGAAAVLATTILLVGAMSPVHPLALALATAALSTAIVRTLLSFRELHELPETRRLSLTDDLTGLPNRRSIMRELDHALEDGDGVAVLLIDLNGFKELNDALGHHAGDEVLCGVAGHLRDGLRPGDVAARLGGDEFAVLLRNQRAPERVAHRLAEAVAQPVAVDGLTLRVGVSIGIARSPDDGERSELLLRRADLAMYRAKQDRRAVYVYDGELASGAVERLRLAGELPRALERRELALHYQPIADMRTGRISAVEGLVRWQHPTQGLLAPAAFLPALERSDLAPELTRQLLAQAVADAAAWRAQGRPLTVSVNLTATDVLDESLPGEVAKLLLAHGAHPGDLQLEVTESDVVSDIDRARSVICGVRELGVHVALDDFGTGHSSLTHLQRLPVDVLKIDRSFVVAAEDDPATAAIVRSLIALAHELGQQVVGEGIERAETWRRLAGWGCDHGQGWLVSGALPRCELDASAPELDARALRAAGGPAMAMLPSPSCAPSW